jgi:prepilin-type N-terminal cleavage/methylation domain-containing protein
MIHLDDISITKCTYTKNNGFTIVELLVVIVVIGILATIAIASYTGVAQQAIASSLKADLKNGLTQLKIYQTLNQDENYPGDVNDCPVPTGTNICLDPSGDNILTYIFDNNTNPKTFTLTATNGTVSYKITEGGEIALASSGPGTQGPSSPGVTADDNTTGTVSWSGVDINPPYTTDLTTAISTEDSTKFAEVDDIDGTYVNPKENSIKILKNGSFVGTDKSTGLDLGSSWQYLTYGGSTDLWGTTWTSDDINDTDFGVGISVKVNNTKSSHYLKAHDFGFSIPSGSTIDGITVVIRQAFKLVYGGGGYTDTEIDNITITVDYTAP